MITNPCSFAEIPIWFTIHPIKVKPDEADNFPQCVFVRTVRVGHTLPLLAQMLG